MGVEPMSAPQEIIETTCVSGSIKLPIAAGAKLGKFLLIILSALPRRKPYDDSSTFFVASMNRSSRPNLFTPNSTRLHESGCT